MSILENGNPPLTDWTFNSSQNQVGIKWLSRVVKLLSGLDSSTTWLCYLP